MIRILPNTDDDPEFIEIITNILQLEIDNNRPSTVYLTNIDGWFDYKWLSFSGKVLGAIGIWWNRLTLPPFHPNRVLTQSCFKRDKRIPFDYRLSTSRPLHRKQASSDNFNNQVDKFPPIDSLCLVQQWNVNYRPWGLDDIWNRQIKRIFLVLFVSQKDKWEINKTKEISRNELEAMVG